MREALQKQSASQALDWEDCDPNWEDCDPRSTSVFLREVWLSAWLKSCAEDREVLAIPLPLESGDGWALLGRGESRLGPLRVDSLFLNQTGLHQRDAPYIEYNGFPGVQSGDYQQAWQRLFKQVLALPEWEVLRIAALAPDACLALQATLPPEGTLVCEQEVEAPFVDLIALRAEGHDYRKALSRNSRQQINRTQKLYRQAYGELEITRAQSLEQALEWLGRLEVLHQESWQAREQAGAFANPHFKAFVDRAVQKAWQKESQKGKQKERCGTAQQVREVEILRCRAGPRELGYLLNFIGPEGAFNYQSGFVQEADARLKPGLLTHCLAIELHLREGAARYSFLAGEARYKRSLAPSSDHLQWLSFYRPTLKGQALRLAKKWLPYRLTRPL